MWVPSNVGQFLLALILSCVSFTLQELVNRLHHRITRIISLDNVSLSNSTCKLS